MAEARSATKEPIVHVEDFEEGQDVKWKVAWRSWRRTMLRRFFRVRNLIKNGMWPTSLWNLGVVVALVAIVMVTDYPIMKVVNDKFWNFGEYFYIPKGPPYFLPKVVIVSCLIGVIFFIVLLFIRRYLLRLLLSYRGWLYQNPKSQSIKTLIWCILVRIVSGSTPTTFACQLSLPRLPVPSVDSTLNKFLESVEPLFTSEENERLKKEAEEFRKTIAPKLQSLLVLKSWWATNYITDWWEKYIYLMGRSPLAINSNYYTMDNGFWKPTEHQSTRAAGLCYMLMQFKRKIEHEQVVPLLIRNTIPVCMYQYERLFGTTRVPREDFDEIVHYDSSVSKHIVVLRKGIYYKLDMFDTAGQPLAPYAIEKQIEWILQDADSQQESEGARSAEGLASLTTLERTDWARKRTKYLGSGINQESLAIVEKAAFMINLETRTFEGFTERAKFLLHGDGKVIWFDKSMCLHFFPDGRYGLTAEHSWGDAPVVAHLLEYSAYEEVLGELYKDGRAGNPDSINQDKVKPPVQLHWNVTDELAKIINEAGLFAKDTFSFSSLYFFLLQNNEDLDLCVRRHMDFGKGFVKSCKVSPDAFIQLALQLAYYRENSKFALTYEASMTRLYLNGRTETVRSLTKEACEFVKSMVEDNRTTEEKIHLLQNAGKVHQKLYRDCMSAEGWDRHMFALYVACKGLGYESDFLHHALTLPWTLSTSQTPQQQMVGNPTITPEHADKASPGGGFGPVSDQGYGVSYMIPEDTHFWFHVSSKKSCPTTNSDRFVDQIFTSLGEMKQLFTVQQNES
ncbi:carnitine O-palmitoyltransferase 1, liver isoform-like [Amphiura filiformis]|uniref:carnitine O-palmitoyltransferase 1, liver isoform-like n=1 Tax=Amphiura filiformis TaxID=82378 RepID=UPI003B21A160